VHCSWVTSAAYSSPSVVVQGSSGLLDDFREAYIWLAKNTPEDARVMSWWDYGYQISGMANRTTLVDNNTWNNSHIAQVGKAMALPEDRAYPILLKHDVDYVLVVFGGLIGYSSDDINKFLWMVRIGGSTDPKIKEEHYLSVRGDYRIDAEGSKTMLDSMMYRMSYLNFDLASPPNGVDRVRGGAIGLTGFKMKHLEEAFTSQHWMVRIYKVRKPFNRGPVTWQKEVLDPTHAPPPKKKGTKGKLSLKKGAMRLMRTYSINPADAPKQAAYRWLRSKRLAGKEKKKGKEDKS